MRNMRSIKQELITIASQTSQNFDREGVLVLKERQDGFFRRSEGLSPRWFRLRGNLLFYLRGTEPLSEPMGVIILGHHCLTLRPQDENGHWPFQIVWDNGVCYRMATYLESERTLWVKAIQSAPYDNLRAQISTLKEKLNKIKPILDISTWRQQREVLTDMNEIPLCELALSCDNLLCDSHGRPPSAWIVLYIQYSKGVCIQYGNTEIVNTCSNPSFSKTILFRACDNLTADTLVRIAVYDVKEQVSETKLPLGFASLLLSTIQEAQRLRIALTRDSKTVGFVTLNGWSLEPAYIGASPTHTNDGNSVDIPQKVHCHRRSQSLPPRLGVKLKFPSIGCLLKQNFTNSYRVTYRFHSGLGGDITVHEIMAESKLCFHMPIQLLDIFIEREKESLQEMLSLGEINAQWRTKQLELAHAHITSLKHYWHAKRTLQCRDDGVYFKRSSHKDDPHLEFAPVNLHLQRMWVHNDTLNKTGFHDVITVGAFTAHCACKSERSGGLIRLVQQVKDINSTTAALSSATASKIQAEYDNFVSVRRVRDEISDMMERIVGLVAVGGGRRSDDVTVLLEAVVSRTRSVMLLWDPAAVDEAASFVLWHRARKGTIDGQTLSTIDRLSEQLNRFEHLSSDYEAYSSSGSSSKETSPCVDTPTLSASVPDIICSKQHTTSTHFGDIKEGAELHFHNEYFKREPLVGTERCSSLRLSKTRQANEANSLSLDHSNNRERPDFKSSNSLEHVSYSSLSTLDKEKKVGKGRRESLTLGCFGQRYTGPSKSQASSPMTTELQDALTAVVDSVRRVLERNVTEQQSENVVSELRACAQSLRSSLDALLPRLRLYRATLRLRHESTQWTRANASLQLQRDTCFSQALTAVTTGLVCWLSSTPSEVVLKVLSSGLGPLCEFEGLLSLYATEKSMWGDMVVAVEDLQTVLFTLVNATQSASGIPLVSGARGSLTVHIPISDALYHKFTNKEHLSFTITAVFFNIGINEKASLAEALGETRPQSQSNSDNWDRLHKYYHKYSKIFPEDNHVARASSRCKPLEEVMETLRLAVQRKCHKNVQVLQLSALASRRMHALRFTSCKSAKDRTGMSATLEQCSILAAEYHLAENEFDKALSILRSEGCRRENTHKNIGVRKYAFTKRQVAALPNEYRPPTGTYGSYHT